VVSATLFFHLKNYFFSKYSSSGTVLAILFVEANNMVNKYTKLITMFLSYTLCLAPIHSNDISKAKEYSWSASMQYIEGNYLEAALLFQKSLEFREKETPMYSTLYKLRLYSLWNHSKDHFCS
jgi:hypothetical protein